LSCGALRALAQRALWDMAALGGVRLMKLGAEDCPRMRELMWKYRDLPMDLADAAPVRAAELAQLNGILEVLLTRRDGRIAEFTAAASETRTSRGCVTFSWLFRSSRVAAAMYQPKSASWRAFANLVYSQPNSGI
jgi:hypothetical protein